MSKHLSTTWTIFLLFLTLLASAVLLTVSPAAGQTENLLLNGDFEEGFAAYKGDASIQIAAGWTPFWVTEDLDIPENPNGNQPAFMASDSPQSPYPRAYTGNKAQLWHTKFSTAFAGVSQRVPVPPESTVRLTAWTTAWSSEGGDPLISQNGAWVRQRIGIDPFGETDPSSPNIVWSQPGQFVDTWGRISVEATSQADHVTVFLSAYPNRHLPQNDIYFDNAGLVLVSFDLAEPSGGGVPLVAPTVDPLLTGLVTGQGVAPGLQGLTFDEAASNAIAETPSLAFGWLVLAFVFFGIAVAVYVSSSNKSDPAAVVSTAGEMPSSKADKNMPAKS